MQNNKLNEKHTCITNLHRRNILAEKKYFHKLKTRTWRVNRTLRIRTPYLYTKGKTRIWGDPPKSMRLDVTLRKFP